MIKLKLTESDRHFVHYPFYKDGKILEKSPHWGMTLLSAGNMRFRWNETNRLRDKTLFGIIQELSDVEKVAVPVQLDHTKIVYDVKQREDTFNKIGDGIITGNFSLVPVVTVADCVPIYFFDSEKLIFGIVHSGWKGTGIIKEALELAEKKYGSKIENICVAIGAHIHQCCYVVNEERAQYFRENFCESCVKKVQPEEPLCKGAAASWKIGSGEPYRLSLLEANLAVLEKAGVKNQNIVVLDECTCCNPLFGSNRRETASGRNEFTVQAAFIV